jgi:hypothetical protein
VAGLAILTTDLENFAVVVSVDVALVCGFTGSQRFLSGSSTTIFRDVEALPLVPGVSTTLVFGRSFAFSFSFP